ncbi:MAG: hypothetical protein AUH86_07540 [Acidobacteria bacterium 13_1_40CM_4_58_4]|nr:MAG: hypothetical protein AUH86_07540 [Acidobacteria bacterium 13_1_40CM_4_58_4]
MVRKFSALVVLAGFLVSPAAGFDTYWLSQCSQKVGEQFGFTEDAWKIMQLGNFSPDFFGPVSEYASKNLKGQELEVLNQSEANNPQVRGAAIFFHFDNLNSDFQSNSDFGYLFSHLLGGTQNLLASYNKLHVDERTRKVLTLITLGASLHAVQDFYSHSDWIHNDFDKTDAKMVKLPSGGFRAPTWFEFLSKHTDPNKWPFQVKSGIYPPIASARNTHTRMNHDNSRLMYTEYENPGQPLRSQAEYHNAGPVPARGDDASDLAHQQLAVNTATAASIEWVKKVEDNSDARKAIESAKGWNLKTHDPHLAKELEAGTVTEMAISCAAGKWDGDDPPGDRGTLCRSVLERKMNSIGGTTGSQLESEIIGLAANLVMPFALKFTGMFWDVHGQYHILERLAEGVGSNSGHYSFAQK